MYLTRQEVEQIMIEAIINREILMVQYRHVDKTGDIVTRKKAPFDIGSSNPNYDIRNRNKDNVYMFCYDHIDKKTNMNKPFVHPINIDRIISIEKTGGIFDENELADINFKNCGFDYRANDFVFALLPNRNWFIN